MIQMKQFSKKTSVFRALSVILTVSAIISRVLARAFAYDTEIGYFRQDTLLPILSYLFLGLIAVLAIASLFAYRKIEIPDTVVDGMRHVCIAERVASVLAFLIILSANCTLIFAYWIKGSAVLLPSAFTAFGAIVGFFAAFYFLLCAIPTRRGKIFHTVCGFAVILFGLYIVGVCYFDLYTPMNNPVKMLCQITTIASLLFMLTDLRFALDSIRTARFLFTSTLTLGFSAVAIFTGPFFSVLNGDYNILYQAFHAVNLAIFLYAVVRTSRFVALMTQEEEEIPENDDDGEKIDDGNSDEISDERKSPSENENFEEKPSEKDEADKGDDISTEDKAPTEDESNI